MKKIISALMVTTMCISTLLPAPVMAQENVAFEVSISAVNEVGAVGANAEQSNAGKKFTANVTVNSGADMIDHFTYQWGRDWTPIKNETNQTYIPGNDYLNYINRRVFVKAFDADRNILFLGDTWIDEAQVVSYVKDNFNGADVNFIGTKSKANYPDIKFEGMKNFTTKNFVENSNGFDFGGYLQNNSLTAPDTVVLFMGSNDVSANIESDVTVENIRAVINAIHSYNSNIKIKVCTVPNPADTDEAALRKFKVMRLNRKLLAAFDDMIANVSIAEVHAGVDSAYSFEILEETYTNGSIVYRYADVIYPAAAGYHQCADIIYAGL